MIALLYSGNLRTFPLCVKNHAEVFGPADVYMSISDEWGYTDKINDPWHKRADFSDLPWNNEGKRRREDITSELIERLLPKEFSLKGLKITQNSNLVFKDKLRKDNHLLYQYWYNEDCFDLVKKDYDLLVRIRPDITIQWFRLYPEKIVFSSHVWYHKLYDYKTMNEMIWTAPPELMGRTCRILKNIKQIDDTLPLVMLYGESVFHEHLKIEGLLNKIEFFEYGWRVWR
jgi:hypothetical protein